MSSPEPVTPPAKMGRLLVVDNDARLMTALCDALGQHGYEAVGFTIAAEALETLRTQEFDLLLTDLNMPQMDGIALLAAAFAVDPHLVSIVMTGHGTIQTAVQAIKHGAFDYVEKPLAMRDLLPTLARALEVRQLRRENLQLRETLGIYELSVTIGFTLDLDTILDKVMDAALLQCEANEVSILLSTPDGKDLQVAAARGPRREELLGRQIAVGENIAGWVASHHEPLILNGPVHDLRFAPVRPREDIYSAISLAMMAGGHCVGVLNVNATKPRRPFTLGQVKALTILAGTAASALKSATLYAQLCRREEQFRRITTNMLDFVCQVGKDGKYQYVTPSCHAMLGYRPDEMIGKSVFDIIHPDDRARSRQLYESILLKDEPVSLEFRCLHAGGRSVWLESVVSVLKDETGQTCGLIAASRDISERKKAEHQSQLILEAAPDAMLVADHEGKIVLVNGQAEKLFGYARVEMIGEPVEFLMPHRFRDRHIGHRNEYFAKPVSRGMGAKLKLFGLRKDAEEVPVEVSLSPVKVGEYVHVIVAIRDITLRRQAEESQRQSELLFRLVWDKSVDGMRLIDADGKIQMVNEAFCRMVGKSGEELDGQPYIASYAEGQQIDLFSGYEERFASRTVQPHYTKDVVLWNGKKVHFELSNSFLEMPGRPPLLLSIIHDVTDQKNLEAQFRQAQKMEAFGQLAGGIAHDFNNLLTIITGYSEMILGGMVRGDKQQDLIREIRKAGERAASLTRQLLAFSRKQLLQTVALDLNALVSEMEKMLRRLIDENIDLAAILDPNLGRVKADPGQVEQVIMNLVVNARDAMPTGGHLTIETRNMELDETYAAGHTEAQPGKYVMLAVTDSGCGMNAATKAKIFEPFFTTKEVGKGTGLGLATVHGIVKQSGGSIEVYSEVGQGTTFKVFLPRVNDKNSSGRSFQGFPLAHPGTETILLAEDEEAVRAIVRLALEAQGYTVLAAQNGVDALQICRAHSGPIHLLVTDVVMPKMSGRELVDLVAALRPKIKMLYLSGYTDDAVVRHGVLEAGMAFLQKPFTPMNLARKVREVLDT